MSPELQCDFVNSRRNVYNKDGEDNVKWAVSLYHFAISSLSEEMLSKDDTQWTTIDGTASLKIEFSLSFH